MKHFGYFIDCINFLGAPNRIFRSHFDSLPAEFELSGAHFEFSLVGFECSKSTKTIFKLYEPNQGESQKVQRSTELHGSSFGTFKDCALSKRKLLETVKKN